MAFIRSSSAAGQASVLALASAERSHRLAEESSERLRAEGRDAAERAAQARIAAAEQRARDAETRAETRIAQVRAEAEDRLGTTAAALARALANLAVLERQVVAGAEAETVRLALAIAGRVLSRTIHNDPTWMHDLFIAALAEVPDRRRVIVRCCPSDAAEIRSQLAKATQAVPGTERLEIEEDTALRHGSLVLASSGTRLDTGVPGSWERLSDQLLATVPRPPMAMRDDGSEVTP